MWNSFYRSLCNEKNKDYTRIVGIDPGVRQFMTMYSDEKISENRQKRDLLKILNAHIDALRKKKNETITTRRNRRVQLFTLTCTRLKQEKAT